METLEQSRVKHIKQFNIVRKSPLLTTALSQDQGSRPFAIYEDTGHQCDP